MILCSLLGTIAPTRASDLLITFPEKGKWGVWTGRDYPDFMPKVTDTEEATNRVTLPNETAGLLVFVWDKSTGNMASRSVDQLRGQWDLKKDEFTRVFRTLIRVESQGQPVASAMIRLSSLSKDTSKLLSPGDRGMVDFFALPTGSIKVSTEYKTKGSSKVSPVQTFELPLQRTIPEPSFTVNINDEVDLAETPSPMTQEKGNSQPKAEAKGEQTPKDSPSQSRHDATPNVLGSVLVFVLVAAAVLAGIWLLLRILQKNPKVIEDNLTRIGVTMPSADPADDGPAPIAKPMPQGPQKIVLDNADPTSLAVQPVAAPAGSWQPRLTSANGVSFALTEGNHLVTREPGSALSFPVEASISRRHAEIKVQSGEVRLIDLGSTNGTFVNGRRLAAEQVLNPGDNIQFGSFVLRFEA